MSKSISTSVSKSIKILFIAAFWPELNASASAIRVWGLIRAFQQSGWEITYVSTAKRNAWCDALEQQGVRTISVRANSSEFDKWLTENHSDFAVFEQFALEEQFSWKFQEISPQTIRILDTQDLHFLRRARQEAVEAKSNGAGVGLVEFVDLNLFREDAFREIACILRSDCSLIISDFEVELLRTQFQVPDSKIHLCRFFYPELPTTPRRGFEERGDFVMIGNFRHPPNADGVRWLRTAIWPEIRRRRPNAEVHVYGAYPSREFMDLNDASCGFHVRGPAEDACETLGRYRVNLAPLRFGAGIKGKISDGWWSGTPAVSTRVGAEGMQVRDGSPWGGAIADTVNEFVEKALALNENETQWRQAQGDGFRLLKELFDEKEGAKALLEMMMKLLETAPERRIGADFASQMLGYHSLRSSKYFSKWIEEKSARKAQL